MAERAEKTIGQLPALDELNDDALIPTEQSGVAYKMTGLQIKEFAQDAVQDETSRAEAAADRAEAAADDAEAYSTNAPYIGGNDNWYTYNSSTHQMSDSGHTSRGQQGVQGVPGDDGVSPTVSISKVGKVTTITITDADGVHTATINDGADGSGAGDMVAATYDPTNKAQDIFAYTDNAVAGKGTYSKPSGGIPKTDLASDVQTSLGKADTAYQKPSTGIPKSALASAVQTSLGKADTALQAAPIAETTVSLTAAGWTGSSAPYSQQVSVTGVASGKIVILDLNLTAGQTDAAALEAWNNICKYGQTLGSGTITFYVDTKPSAAVSVRVGVIG